MNKELRALSKRVKNTPMKKFDRLNFLYVRIIILLDYMVVIDANAKQLMSAPGKLIIKTNQEPAMQLKEYIILEICSFYDYVKTLTKKNKSLKFPVLPIYLSRIYAFRGMIVGHMDKDEKLKSREEFNDSYKYINKIGFDKIVDDWHKYYGLCELLLGDDI